jgi:hypothetical protein
VASNNPFIHSIRLSEMHTELPSAVDYMVSRLRKAMCGKYGSASLCHEFSYFFGQLLSHEAAVLTKLPKCTSLAKTASTDL